MRNAPTKTIGCESPQYKRHITHTFLGDKFKCCLFYRVAYAWKTISARANGQHFYDDNDDDCFLFVSENVCSVQHEMRRRFLSVAIALGKLARSIHRHHLLLRSFQRKWAFNHFNLAFIVMQCKRSAAFSHFPYTPLQPLKQCTHTHAPVIRDRYSHLLRFYITAVKVTIFKLNAIIIFISQRGLPFFSPEIFNENAFAQLTRWAV